MNGESFCESSIKKLQGIICMSNLFYFIVLSKTACRITLTPIRPADHQAELVMCHSFFYFLFFNMIFLETVCKICCFFLQNLEEVACNIEDGEL